MQARDLIEELITESSEMLQSRPIRRYGPRRHPPSDIRSFLTIRPSQSTFYCAITLRILASDEPKHSKNVQLLNVLPDNFVNTPSFQNLNDAYLVNGP